jgi:hypothetical protein
MRKEPVANKEPRDQSPIQLEMRKILESLGIYEKMNEKTSEKVNSQILLLTFRAQALGLGILPQTAIHYRPDCHS